MPTSTCPICASEQTQSIWYWEKEDLLVRAWAMDTQVNFSICRSCATIFQDPPIVNEAAGETWSFPEIGEESQSITGAHEAIDWLQQFAHVAKDPGTVLEIHTGTPMFQAYMEQEGWTVTSLQLSDLEAGTEVTPPEGGFDLIVGFYVLNRSSNPGSLLEKLRTVVKPEGGLFLEELNPLALPRANEIALTSDNKFVFPYPTMNYLVSKSGFKQAMGEVAANGRAYFTVVDVPAEVQPANYMSPDLWHQTIFRFQRNYYYAWTSRFLRNFLETMASQPDGQEKARTELRKNPFHMQMVREVCGSTFLFVNEVSALNNTISNDWAQTMARILDILNNDFALYDILQCAEVQGLGTLPSINRFHFNGKMVYTTEKDYFEKYFTEEDARSLVQSITQSGSVVVGHLSSFL